MTCEMSCSTTIKLCSGTSSMPLSFTAALILFAMGYIIEQRQLIPIGEINPPQWEHIKHRQISIGRGHL
eukprot:Em0080g8a